MGKDSAVRLTKFEMEVMEALWGLGSASVREIQERLPESRRPAYTTVQTIVYRLEEKGAVRRLKKVGNAHVFEPTVTRRAAVRRLFHELVELFGGSPRAMMAQLVEGGHLTLEDIREAEQALERIESEKGEGGADAAGAAAKAPAAEEKGAARAKGSPAKGPARERRRR